jgi:hypothetical protein
VEVRAEVVRGVVCSSGGECVGFMWIDKGADDIAPCLMFRGDVDKANLNTKNSCFKTLLRPVL